MASSTHNLNSTELNTNNQANAMGQAEIQPKSRTNPNADANHAPAQQDYTADAVFDNDKVSSQQIEGLTDTDALDKQLQQQAGRQANNIEKNPENELDKHAVQKQVEIETNNGSAGNQSVAQAMENLNPDELEKNLQE